MNRSGIYLRRNICSFSTQGVWTGIKLTTKENVNKTQIPNNLFNLIILKYKRFFIRTEFSWKVSENCPARKIKQSIAKKRKKNQMLKLELFYFPKYCLFLTEDPSGNNGVFSHMTYVTCKPLLLLFFFFASWMTPTRSNAVNFLQWQTFGPCFPLFPHFLHSMIFKQK